MEFPVESSLVWETPSTPIIVEDYVFVDGKRFVHPYFFEFIAHVKKRWDRKTIVNLFAEEFRQRPLHYYIEAVKSGRILVDGKMVTCNYAVQASQTLSHFVHRHEPPVMADPVTILDINPEVVTVCKPPSIPVHPCGQYRKNTVVGILQAEQKLGPLYPIHRLDRMVSGLLIFARSAQIADRFRLEIEAGQVQKEYVAKVCGVFPEEEVELNAAVNYDAREGRSTVEIHSFQEKETRAECNGGSMGPVSTRGACKVKTNEVQIVGSKHASTRFQRLVTDGIHSIVKCIPFTGRTHQIRVHLQHLGHPIANDAVYAVENAPTRSQMETTADRAARAGQVIRNRIFHSTSTKNKKLGNTDGANKSFPDKPSIQRTPRNDQSISEKVGTREGENKSIGKAQAVNVSERPTTGGNETYSPKFVVDQMCTHCPYLAPCGYEGDESGLWLHCVRYSGKGWEYKSSLPNWVNLESNIC